MTISSVFGLTATSRPTARTRWLLGALALLAVWLPSMRMAQAQYVKCPPVIDLKKDKLPEIVSQQGRLRGTIVLANEQRYQVLTATNNTKCVSQIRRFYRDHENLAPKDVNKVSPPIPPIPGPTLRAKLGDVVQLTFLNHIDLLDYGDTIDRWENSPDGPVVPGAGCDSVTGGGYPQLSKDPVVFDEWPNCFHGSSTGNLHFHGTHTNPTSTGDNVFLGVRPSPRKDGVPIVTGASVVQDFTQFFDQCESRLRADNLLEWPQTWDDMPPAWTSGQKAMLMDYDSGKPEPMQLWPVDAAQIAKKQFPQYYIGSFPYCFILPNYPGTVPPPAAMRMGQAPGTMWYHAHKHGSTALNVSNGMVGAFIIEGDAYDGQLNKFYNRYRKDKSQDWTRQQPTMVVNQLGGTSNLETGRRGQSDFSINGQVLPTVTMYPGEVQLWRIVNASSISGFYLSALPAGFAWRQLAQDGVQFDNFNYKTRAQRPVFVAPGNRVDLLVRAPTNLKSVSGLPVTVARAVSISQAQAEIPPKTTLMTIVLSGRGVAMPLLPVMPQRPVFLTDIAAQEVTKDRRLTFSTQGVASGRSQHTIAVEDGPPQKFNEKTSLKIDPLNTVEEWKLLNTTIGNIDHPFHIHINPFQVIEVFDPNAPVLDKSGHPVMVNGKTVPLYIFSGTPRPDQCLLNPDKPETWKPCGQASPYPRGTNIWWDVFPIPAATTIPHSAVIVPGYIKMRSRFVDYAGSYVLHCHILAHEDRGMMLMVELGASGNAAMRHH